MDSYDTSTGIVAVSIINHQGAVLPTTGGMGTTFFYVAGVTLMIGAAAVLILNKRKARE